MRKADSRYDDMESYQELEARLANQDWVNSNPANVVACASGTAALHLALECLEHKGNVAVPDYTMIACARAVTLAGMVPKFIDCRDNLLINPEQVLWGDKRLIACMAVHVYGRQCNMDRIHVLARERGTAVIEDCAEAHGIRPHPESFAACWSFYKNKIVAGEEGGAILFRDKAMAEKARCLRSMGFKSPHDYSHVPRGHNYRMSNLHAYAILYSLQRIKENVRDRRRVEAYYEERVSFRWRMSKRDVPWVYDIRIKGMSSQDQEKLVRTLNDNRVQARHGFKPCSWQEEYRSGNPVESIASRMSREVIYLPISPDMLLKEVERACELLRKHAPV